ncbi:helix-turn-helix domain-containing protein [Bacillus atrophaeus]|uniref:helix-turn-helix domain-containing protein n=1 Tax=Bacillus atrophaeus TaxID=1452 RepID=UPI00227EDBCE|nr:helix-turn-helix transcriptional regulator [Bacillus atrophaeus]MCY8485387.1 helix-turn-helix domain-containing protein [Bacillus atrophaeus]MCY8488787.1 helix-turn-helix domain-containing protein [Bacillus atrophaeus]MCY8915625.1 helix-turn-helix domain-containing protein [Bacillus atrophaeus]MCY8924335.1 helix-turn-helix domain-containing protein [Bacillus atrophaeus]
MASNYRIKKIRLNTFDKPGRHLSGTYVARKLGISPQYYYEIERGEKNLSAEVALQLAEIFNVSTDYLLGKTEQNESVAETTSSYISKKEEEDIAVRIDEIKEDLKSLNNPFFLGEPMCEEAVESLIEAIEFSIRQTQRVNKKHNTKNKK